MLKTSTQNPPVESLHRLILSNHQKVLSGDLPKPQARDHIRQVIGLSREELVDHLCRNYDHRLVTACEHLDLI